MFELASTTDRISPCCPPLLLSQAIAPAFMSDILDFLRRQSGVAKEIDYACSSSGSTYTVAAFGQEMDDLFQPDREKRKILFAGAIVQAGASHTPLILTVGLSAGDAQLEDILQELRPENAALLKLLDQWSKEPQLGDDQWWDDFDRELRKIRASGWNRS